MLVVKATLDRLFALVGIVLLAPVMIVIGVWVAVKMGRPVIFRQRRPGYKGRIFTLYKFRTMRNAIGPDGKALPDEQRLTRFGKLLRSTSLDELPSLFNVLKGEMSLVGPRPLLESYLSRYTTDQMRRHDRLPGVTGWAQVNGRNALTWDEKFALDLWYIDNWSLALDFKILLMTFGKVVKRSGISNSESATMPEFLGSAVVQDSEQSTSHAG